MEFSAWTMHGNKPDLNGVYQGRFTSNPDEVKYYLYKNGWRVGCDSVEEAYKAIEKFYPSISVTIHNNELAFKLGGKYYKGPVWEWRGLAKKPAGLHRFETSDKYK